MRSFDELEAAWSAATSPRDVGAVKLLVARLGGGRHATPSRALLDVEGGLVGDRWSHGDVPERARQLTLMEARVAALVVAGVQPLDAPGDNVLVDLDLSHDHLPAGTRIRIGAALVEVSPVPHNGCKTFAERFGRDALRWVMAKAHGPRRLRGINAFVIETGEVAIGDAVKVQPSRVKRR